MVANVLNRCLMPQSANKVWAADIAYIRSNEGWLFPAAVIGLYSRQIVGWATSANEQRHGAASTGPF